MKATVCKLAWWAIVYYLWSQRNAVLHVGQIKTEDQIINIIKKDVKTRLQSKECFKNTILNRIMCCNWGICIERFSKRWNCCLVSCSSLGHFGFILGLFWAKCHVQLVVARLCFSFVLGCAEFELSFCLGGCQLFDFAGLFMTVGHSIKYF